MKYGKRRRPLHVSSILLIALLLVACGVNARTQALRASLVTLNVARDTLLLVSKAREAQIVASATSKEEGKALLATWRAGVDKIARAFDDAYHLIYGAALLDDAKSSHDAVTAVADVLKMVDTLKTMKDPL